MTLSTDYKLTDDELTRLSHATSTTSMTMHVEVSVVRAAITEIHELRAVLRKLHAQVDQTDPVDLVGSALTCAGASRGAYGVDDYFAAVFARKNGGEM